MNNRTGISKTIKLCIICFFVCVSGISSSIPAFAANSEKIAVNDDVPNTLKEAKTIKLAKKYSFQSDYGYGYVKNGQYGEKSDVDCFKFKTLKDDVDYQVKIKCSNGVIDDRVIDDPDFHGSSTCETCFDKVNVYRDKLGQKKVSSKSYYYHNGNTPISEKDGIGFGGIILNDDTYISVNTKNTKKTVWYKDDSWEDNLNTKIFTISNYGKNKWCYLKLNFRGKGSYSITITPKAKGAIPSSNYTGACIVGLKMTEEFTFHSIGGKSNGFEVKYKFKNKWKKKVIQTRAKKCKFIGNKYKVKCRKSYHTPVMVRTWCLYKGKKYYSDWIYGDSNLNIGG